MRRHERYLQRRNSIKAASVREGVLRRSQRRSCDGVRVVVIWDDAVNLDEGVAPVKFEEPVGEPRSDARGWW